MSSPRFYPGEFVEAPDGGLWRVLRQKNRRVSCVPAVDEDADPDWPEDVTTAWDASTLRFSPESEMNRIMALPKDERP